MKNLDFFRKPKSSSIKSTVYGGIISIVCLLILFVLVIYQIATFEQKTSLNEVIVENDIQVEAMVLLELNLTINDISCLLINPMITSEVDSGINSIEDVFTKTRIYTEDGIKKYELEDNFVERIEAAENEEEIK